MLRREIDIENRYIINIVYIIYQEVYLLPSVDKRVGLIDYMIRLDNANLN